MTTGKPRKAVRVWAEVGITVCVNEDTREFIKMSYGHERIAPNDDPATLKRYETLVFEHCEEVVEGRIKRLERLLKQSHL